MSDTFWIDVACFTRSDGFGGAGFLHISPIGSMCSKRTCRVLRTLKGIRDPKKILAPGLEKSYSYR